MENIFSIIRNRMSSALNAYKQRMEGLYGETVRSKSYKTQIIISLFVVVGVLLTLGLNDLYESHKLSNYGVETDSFVYAYNYLPRGNSSSRFLTKCRFQVDGTEYQAKYPINRPLKYGDTLRVLYFPENPKINKLIIPDSLKASNYNYLEDRYED